MPETYLVQCFNCLSDYDAAEAVWCSCNPQNPTKVCPFCLVCFCQAGQEFKDAFWRDSPEGLKQEVGTLSQSRMLLGEMLVRAGLVSTSQLLDALKIQKDSDLRIGEILVETGALSADRLQAFLKTQHTAQPVDMSRARVDAVMLAELGVRRCIDERILPLEAESFRDRRIMTLVMADPSDVAAVERVIQGTGNQVIPGVASEKEIIDAIRCIYPQDPDDAQRRPDPAVRAASPGPAGPPAVEPEPVSITPETIVDKACKHRASHVHIQIRDGQMRLLYRIDGALYQDRTAGAEEASRLLEAFKSLAGLEPSGSGASHLAGRVAVGERTLIVRWSRADGQEALIVKPAEVDRASFPPTLDSLGLSEDALLDLRKALSAPSGLVVVSSPPQSGASSTLYAAASELIAAGRSVVLVESPRIGDVPGATQIEFATRGANSFDDALGHAATSGAEVVIVTAPHGMPWRGHAAALTGRMLVVCRVGARSLPAALLSVAADGFPPAMLADRPALFLHQYLVRRLCEECRAEVPPAEANLASLGLAAEEMSDVKLWKASGCPSCGPPTPGFRGRTPLTQTLVITPAVSRAVAAASARDVAAACRAAGLRTMRSQAIAAMAAGRTAIEEIAGRSFE